MKEYIAIFICAWIFSIGCWYIVDFLFGNYLREIREELRKLNRTMEKISGAGAEEKTQV